MSYKFICLNVWNGGKLWEPMVAWLKNEQPDILALQEVFLSQDPRSPKADRTIEELQKELDLPYAEFAPAFLNTHGGKELEKGNAVLSRFPLTPQPTLFYDQPYGPMDDSGLYGQDYTLIPRNLQQVTVQLPKGPLHVFNTQGIWGHDGKDNPRRAAMGEKILTAISNITTAYPNQLVILCGDFNVDEKSQTITKIGTQLTNIFAGERTTSFQLTQKTDGGYATAVVDFMFTTPQVHVLSHSSTEPDISDHLPLVVQFTVKN